MTEEFPPPVIPIMADEVQLIDWGESRTLGSWVRFRLSGPELLDVFRGLDTATQKRAGHVFDLLLAESSGGPKPGLVDSVPRKQKEPDLAPYGEAAKLLRLSGFCRKPEVWRALGKDADFLAWLRSQPCAAPRMGAPGPCAGDIVAAHVRRIANGAGTGIKPPYSAIPLCDHHHREQHAAGESCLAPRDVWDATRMRAIESWAWERLRGALGVSSMAEADPVAVRRWAESHNVTGLLPDGY
jgi:hypothetical protein